MAEERTSLLDFERIVRVEMNGRLFVDSACWELLHIMDTELLRMDSVF